MDGHFELVAGAFSTHAETNQKTAETWGVTAERTYDDYHELLKAEKGKLDAVVVLAPTDYHKDIVIDALRAGFPVVCEKSLATSFEEGEEIAKVVAETKGFFCTTYNYTGYPMVANSNSSLPTASWARSSRYRWKCRRKASCAWVPTTSRPSRRPGASRIP